MRGDNLVKQQTAEAMHRRGPIQVGGRRQQRTKHCCTKSRSERKARRKRRRINRRWRQRRGWRAVKGGNRRSEYQRRLNKINSRRGDDKYGERIVKSGFVRCGGWGVKIGNEGCGVLGADSSKVKQDGDRGGSWEEVKENGDSNRGVLGAEGRAGVRSKLNENEETREQRRTQWRQKRQRGGGMRRGSGGRNKAMKGWRWLRGVGNRLKSVLLILVTIWMTRGMVGAMNTDNGGGGNAGEMGGVVSGVAAAIEVWRRRGMRGTNKRKTMKVSRVEGADATGSEADTQSSTDSGNGTAQGTEGGEGLRDEDKLHKENEWAGDKIEGAKKAGDMVFSFQNVRRIKGGAQAERQQTEIVRAAKLIQADIVGLADSGTEEGLGKLQGKYDPFSSCGKLTGVMRKWGGNKMTCFHSQGRYGNRGASILGKAECVAASAW